MGYYIYVWELLKKSNLLTFKLLIIFQKMYNLDTQILLYFKSTLI